MAIMSSPWRSAPDSPSRQLLWELSKLSIASNKEFHARLDRDNEEREAAHKKALAAAAAAHERVREGAELACRELQLQVENELRKREEEQRRQLEKARQEQVERELEVKKRKEEDRARTAELEARRAEEGRRAEAEATARAKKAEGDQKAAQAERASKESQNSKVQSQVSELKAAQTSSTPPTQAVPEPTAISPKSQPSTQASAPANAVTAARSQLPNASELATEHERYLTVHRECKALRAFMAQEARKSPQLKTAMGNMRRELRKSVGQLRAGKNANRTPLANIINTLKEALVTSSPPYPVQKFVYLRPDTAPSTAATGPSLLLYLLNIFSKAIIAQLISEAGIEPTQKADPIGTIASHIFALDFFHWNGNSLINILIAKFHVTCPVLFGVYGPETTNAGKSRLGWAQDGGKEGPLVSHQDHQQRMIGLGAGFAGISLRNYQMARNENPFPATNYWTALSNIVNVPAQHKTDTHAIVMKAMIEGFEDRILLFFGDMGKLALKMAVVEWVRDVPRPGSGTKALALLEDVMKKEKKIVL